MQKLITLSLIILLLTSFAAEKKAHTAPTPLAITTVAATPTATPENTAVPAQPTSTPPLPTYTPPPLPTLPPTKTLPYPVGTAVSPVEAYP